MRGAGACASTSRNSLAEMLFGSSARIRSSVAPSRVVSRPAAWAPVAHALATRTITAARRAAAIRAALHDGDRANLLRDRKGTEMLAALGEEAAGAREIGAVRLAMQAQQVPFFVPGLE